MLFGVWRCWFIFRANLLFVKNMKKTTFLLSLGALMLGLFILGVSLFSVQSVLSFADDATASHRQLYFNSQILPDHVAYPVFMMFDRVRLATAPPGRRLQLQLDYAWRRLETSQQLMAKNKPDLALDTLTKSQHYFLQALIEAENLNLNSAVGQQAKTQFATDSTHYLTELKTACAQFKNPQRRAAVDKLFQTAKTSNL